MHGISVSIWCETKHVSIRQHLSNYFSKDDILSIDYFEHTQCKESARKVIVPLEPLICYKLTDALNMRQNKGCNVMPNDLKDIDWEVLNASSVAYQRVRNSNGPPPGFGDCKSTKNNKTLRLKPSKTQKELEEKSKLRAMSEIQRIMSNIRTLYDNYYKVEFCQDLELKLRTILNEEKCPLSMVGYDADDNIDDDVNDNKVYDNSLGFAVLKCRLLNCQHVVRLSFAQNVKSDTFRTFHDSEFDHIHYESLDALSYAPNLKNEQPRRRFKIELKFFHLLSDACSDSIYIPEQVQSIFDATNCSEYVLLYYDESISPYSANNAIHSVDCTKTNKKSYLRFVRGRICGSLADLNSKKKYCMNFTYDLSKNVNNIKEKETNGGIVLEHIESSTNSSYKFYIKKEAVSNVKNPKNVYFKYQLIALKIEFLVKQSTPTLSPTFGVTNNNNNQQNVNSQQKQQQPQQPQQQRVNISPAHNAIHPQPLNVMNLAMNAMNATPPQPLNINNVQIRPTTPSQNAVISVTTPTALQSLNATQFAAQFVNSPQIPSLGGSIGQTTPNMNANPNNTHSYQITNVSNLTAPNAANNVQSLPTFPMSPGGSIGLTQAANMNNVSQQMHALNMQQHMQSQPNLHNMYATATAATTRGHVPNTQQQQPQGLSGNVPPSSTPMLSTNTATNIQSILSQTVMHGQGLQSSSVSNMANMSHPYSPLVDPNNVRNSSMTFAHAVNSVTNPLNLGLSNQYVPTNASPAMSYVQSSASVCVPPMSPATQSINSSLSSLDPQAQQFALMSGNGINGMNVNNVNVNGYTQYNAAQNIMGLNQPQMINSINRGLMQQQQQQMQSQPQQLQQHSQPVQPQHHSQHNNMRNGINTNMVTVVNKQRHQQQQQQQQRGYNNHGQQRQSYHLSQPQQQYRQQQQQQNNYHRQKIRDKAHQNKRLHAARINNQRIMGRGAYHHHQMGSTSTVRKLRNSLLNNASEPNMLNMNNNMNKSQQLQSQPQQNGKSAFGFPANANPMTQQQLNNESNNNHNNNNNSNNNGVNEGKESENNNKDAKDQNLSLNDVMSPSSEDNNNNNGKDKENNNGGNNNNNNGGNNGNILSPKTPTMIDHVVDRVYFIAKTQSGSRFVQEKLSDKQYFGLFFKELQSHVAELMVDNFGHYAIEALFSHCDDMQRLVLVHNLAHHMPQVACHKQGSFSIQAMMDTLSTEEQIKFLVEALNRDVKKIILNHSGHYVILRFLQRYDYPYSKFIHKALMQHTLDLATDHYGLRVMKASVDAGPTQEMTPVFAAIVKHANTLVENQYGNYIIQHLLDLGPKEVTDTVKEKMHGKFVRYSKQKFSSNVVEKCLRHSANELKHGIGEKDWTTVIVRELLTKAGDLISDKYGNYCLQTALQAATDHPCLLQEFAKSTKPHLDTLRENVKAKWCKLLESAIEKQKKRREMTMFNQMEQQHRAHAAQMQEVQSVIHQQHQQQNVVQQQQQQQQQQVSALQNQSQQQPQAQIQQQQPQNDMM